MTEIFVNNQFPFAAHLSSRSAGEAFHDLMRVYTPYGPVKTITAPFRPGLGVGGYSGAADPFSLDYSIARQLESSGFQAGLDRQIYGGGKGMDLYGAMGSSLGEAVERMLGSYASLDVDDAEGVLATYAQMRAEGRDCLGPKDFPYFLDSAYDEVGFLFKRWEEDTQLFWVAGTRLLSGGTVWVPAQFVHLFHLMRTGESAVGLSSSGGLATHLNAERAIAHGVLELVERDAINLRWFSRIPPVRIELDVDIDDREISKWLSEAERADLHVEFFLQTVDIDDALVVTAIAWDDALDEWSYFAGGGVGLDIVTAIRSALSELVQSERMIRIPTLAPNWELSFGIDRMFGSAADLRPEEFENFIQVVPFYGHKKNREKLEWYFKSPNQETVALSTLLARGDELDYQEEYDQVLELCAKHGFDPVIYDLTPDTFDRVSLFKVIIPELVPAFAPSTPLLGHPRYQTIARDMGYRSDLMPPEEFTTDPLPYP